MSSDAPFLSDQVSLIRYQIRGLECLGIIVTLFCQDTYTVSQVQYRWASQGIRVNPHLKLLQHVMKVNFEAYEDDATIGGS